MSINSREVEQGDLFVGLKGEKIDGGEFAEKALEAGAWGVLVAPEHAKRLAETNANPSSSPSGVVLESEDPLKALQDLARAWLGELREEGAKVVGVTGSTGKTTTKDILTALLAGQRRTVASPENKNTEIGMPMAILGAPKGTEVLVLEMAMRGKGQIAQLAEIAREPDVGVIVNVGPVHLEQMGSIEDVAEAKAELIAGLRTGGSAVVPADEPRLEPYRRADVRTITFGAGGDVRLKERGGEDGSVVVVDGTEEKEKKKKKEKEKEMVLRIGFKQEHNLRNLEAAVAAARALGVTPAGEVRVRFSKMRGERRELPGGGELIEDCYNANPMSMRAAIDDLVQGESVHAHTTHTRTDTDAHTRTVAVLGDMLELGPEEGEYHRELGEYAAAKGVEVLIAVGPRARRTAQAFAAKTRGGETHTAPDAETAAELLQGLLEPGDKILVKGSRGIGLERVAEALEQPAQTAERR